MASSHFVTCADFSLLGNTDTHQLVDAWRQFITLFPREYFDFDDFTALTMRYAQRSIFDLSRFFTKDGPQKLFLGSEFGFALWRNLADKDILRRYFGTIIDDAMRVEIALSVFASVWDIPGDL